MSFALREAMQANVGSIAHDPLRPEFHLMPQHNWMNDPNGPVWWKGQYHLFYQLNPHAAVWGDMHWGHAISPDMIHWRHQPIALAPTPGGPDSEGCFSGSAVVFDGKPAFIYTGVQNAPPDQATIRDGNDKLRETQLLAIAEDDKLLHWKKVEKPIIPTPPPGMMVTGFRDPCPWREGDMWYVGIGSGEREVGGCVLLYRSKDLHRWEYLHKLTQGKPNGKVAVNPCDSGEMWECPDFFGWTDIMCFSIHRKTRSSGPRANTTRMNTSTSPCGPAFSIKALLITRPRALWHQMGGAFCGDGCERRGLKHSLLLPDGLAPWAFRACSP